MRARSVRTSVAWRCAAAALFALSVSLLAPPARADDAQQFELLQGLSSEGQWEEVLKRIQILLDPSNPACAQAAGAATTAQTCHLADGVLIERSREMELVALAALKRESEADPTIEKILRQNPTYVPDPAALPAAMVTRVRDIKTRMQKELEEKARKEADEKRKAILSMQTMSDAERRWVEELARLASRETVVEKRSRLFAFVPFGVGQLQNGDKGWGIFFFATQALTGGASIGLATAWGFYASVDVTKPYADTGKLPDRRAVYAIRDGLALGNQVAFAAWAALAIGGIIQANVAFEPEAITTRERKLPKRPAPTIAPTVAGSPGGVSFGLVGTF